MVFVQLGGVSSDAVSNNSGVFTGQNIQNAWDSHSPGVSVHGLLMGDSNIATCRSACMWNLSWYGQPIYDMDSKEVPLPRAAWHGGRPVR
ncbi:hypothetical protein [Alicyclobacillus sp.]|uniref:hypothetical protein n=1 Tax=Alicyclobacillus sp. TaxID=61169 RepID=UPI0025BE290E|nr:hypothetical protein [Alicyclobacillus sp.]MCL6516731.1 hypothetical protein [Alicyclobacillus sp.]